MYFYLFKVFRHKDGYVAIKENDGTYSFTRVPQEKRIRDMSIKYGGQVRQRYLEFVFQLQNTSCLK